MLESIEFTSEPCGVTNGVVDKVALSNRWGRHEFLEIQEILKHSERIQSASARLFGMGFRHSPSKSRSLDPYLPAGDDQECARGGAQSA